MIKPKNLLIVRTDRIGDVVLSLPLAKIIKRHYPDCRITFLLRKYTKDLAENHPHINEIIVLEEKHEKISFWNNVKTISAKNFDSTVIVYPTFKTVLIIFLSGIKNRIGTGYRWYSFLFNKKIFEHRKYAQKHELEYNVGLLKAFGIDEKVSPGNVEFDLQLNKDAGEFVEAELLRNHVDPEKLIVIVHPGSGGSAVDLPVEKIKRLVKLILNSLDVEVIITGSITEVDLCESIKDGTAAKNFAGKFSLSELTVLIDKSAMFISNSTGPLHIAAALNKPVVGFYPKIFACSPVRWGPYSKKSAVFQPKIECSDCSREQCERLDCMNSIEVTEVFAEIEKNYKFLTTTGDIND